MKQSIEWIKCKDGLPENPTSPLDWKKYWTVRKTRYGLSYSVNYWAYGWNCSMNFDGTIYREHEIKDVIAWAEIPEYEE